MTRDEFWLNQYNRYYDFLIANNVSLQNAVRIAEFHATRVTNEAATRNMVPWEMPEPDEM